MIIDKNKLNSYITTLMPGGEVVVDLGCGAGMSLDELGQLYRTAIGFDVSRNRFDRRFGPPMVWRFALANVNHGVPLRSGCANAVLANQVIEHIADPEHFAKEIYRILQPHGMAVITTPNIRYVKHLWKLVVLGQGLKTSDQNEGDGSWDDGHIHYFTHNDLYSIFMAAGFKRVESQALVDQRGALPRLRVIFDHLARVYPVREFLSGNILVVATR